MTDIFENLNINSKEYKNYRNYIANLSNENKEYDTILKSLSGDSPKTFNLNNQLNTINYETVDKQLFNQLEQDQKDFTTQLQTYNLVIYGGDRPWMIELPNISEPSKGFYQFRNGMELQFGEFPENLEGTTRVPIHENNIFIPPSLQDSDTYNYMYQVNSKGFCWNGEFYKPYNRNLPNGNIIGYDNIKQRFYGPKNMNCFNRFINVKKIELVHILCPFGEHYLYKPLPNETKIIKYKNNICQYPYILLEIDQFNVESFGTDSDIDKSFAALKHVDQELSTIQLGTRNFIKFVPINGGCKEFLESPLAELTKLTMTLKTPSGDIINQGKDGIKIDKIKVTYAIPEFNPPNKDGIITSRKIYRCTQCNNYKNYIQSGELCHFPKISNYNDYNGNSQKLFYNGIIVIQFDEYVPTEQYAIGDNIVISDFYPSIFSAVDRYFNEYTIESELDSDIEELFSYLYTCLEEHKKFNKEKLKKLFDKIIIDAYKESENIKKLLTYLLYCITQKIDPDLKKLMELLDKIFEHKIFNRPYFADELIQFKKWLNRPEGHIIIWTDSCNTDNYEYYFNKDENYQLGINTIYFYGPIDIQVKKKKNIIKCYDWFENLITHGVPTAKKYEKGKLIPIDKKIPFLSNQYWTELLMCTNRQNESLDIEGAIPYKCKSFIGKKNPLAIYRSIHSKIFGKVFWDNFNILTPQLFYYAFYFIELETVSKFSALNSIFNNLPLFEQNNNSTANTTCVTIPALGGYTNNDNYCMIIPNYISEYYIIDFTYWIDKFKFGSICNLSLQNTYVFKITTIEANTEMLYSKIKNII